MGAPLSAFATAHPPQEGGGQAGGYGGSTSYPGQGQCCEFVELSRTGGSRSPPGSSSVSPNGPQLIVIDESQLRTRDCVELLRYLHDHPTTRFALVLVGDNGTWGVLSPEPTLASRVYRRVSSDPAFLPAHEAEQS